MATVSEALRAFLDARKTSANADMIGRWHIGLETQVNVAAGDGEPVAGKRSTYSDGIDTWFSIRVPKDANTEPSWNDYKLSYSLWEHAEGIGWTGFDWQSLRSRWWAYDFDGLMGHKAGLTADELARVRDAVSSLPYCEVRKSTGGGGLHVYVHADAAGIPCANHTIHAAAAGHILDRMSRDCGFDLQNSIDTCGKVAWIWHRKMTEANQGLALIKPATAMLSEANFPTGWRDRVGSKPEKATSTPRPNQDVVIADFNARSKWKWLEDAEWERDGKTFKRPGAANNLSASLVDAANGDELLHIFSTSAVPLEADKNYNQFDAYTLLCHDGDKEASRAALVKQGFGQWEIPFISCAELARGDYTLTYQIKGMVVAGQPLIFGGPGKGMKTGIALDAAVSVATGSDFLGRFPVEKSESVLINSAESGFATIQETVARICKSKGLCAEEVTNLHLSDFAPRFDNPSHRDALERAIDKYGCKLLLLDPLYLMMNGADAGNLFSQGAQLSPISQICQRHGTTLALVHHFRKKGKQHNQRDCEPPELDDLSWSGFSEFARQWILINRRADYVPESGHHELWMSYGGSAGHSGLQAVTIDEGLPPNRYWDVKLSSPADARDAKKGGTVRDKLLDAMRNYPNGEVQTNIMLTAGIRADCKNKLIFTSLVEEGALVPCEVFRGKHPYAGFRLKV